MKTLVILATLGLAFSAASLARATDQGPPNDFSHFAGFDNLHTSGQIHFNYENGDFNVPQHFSAVRANTEIEADRATGNSKQRQLHATGDVVVHQNSGGGTSLLSQRPSTLTCDQLDVDGERKVYVATGHVHYSQVGGRTATSDTATLDDGAHHLHMQGHVHVEDGAQNLYTDVLDYDTQTTQLDLTGSVSGSAPVDSSSPPKRRRP